MITIFEVEDQKLSTLECIEDMLYPLRQLLHTVRVSVTVILQTSKRVELLLITDQILTFWEDLLQLDQEGLPTHL